MNTDSLPSQVEAIELMGDHLIAFTGLNGVAKVSLSDGSVEQIATGDYALNGDRLGHTIWVADSFSGLTHIHFDPLDNAPELHVELPAPRFDLPRGGSQVVIFKAADNASIARVEFSLNNQLQFEVTEPPYAYDMRSALADQVGDTYTLSAKAFGIDGESTVLAQPIVATVTGVSDAEPPIVAWTGLPNAAVEGSIINLEVDASDDEGAVRVAFYVNSDLVGTDESAPFALAYTVPLVNATTTFNLEAHAIDAAGNVAVASANMDVTNYPSAEGCRSNAC